MSFLSLEGLAQRHVLGEIASVTLFAVGDAFEVRLATAEGTSTLADGDKMRLEFRDVHEALSLLRNIGIWQVGVDVSGWHVAASDADHADWAKAKISAAMAGLRDGSNRVFSAAEWAAIRAAKKASRGAP
ncbi:hypothetical protein GTP81_05000 [Rugamonas sp. FT107W]|uniref:Uncharacterized protein n=1 Tax=Duganella vulcania TaxID=2692166 RepID=A0A845HAI6_9BURK|nr:hypothetical protein [Duganella vulcania]MYN16102.1 hypothetical protein [Duganella vulcania]